VGWQPQPDRPSDSQVINQKNEKQVTSKEMDLPPNSIPTPNGSNLCLECALCCDGSIFPKARLQPQDLEFARSLGLTLNETGDTPAFDQPCHLLHGKACSIYDRERPQVCGTFRCELLKHYLAGEVDFETALDAVQTAHALLVDIQDQMPFGRERRVTFRTIRLMTAYVSSLSEADRAAHASFLEAVTKYIRLIIKEFIKMEELMPEPTSDNSINLEMAAA